MSICHDKKEAKLQEKSPPSSENALRMPIIGSILFALAAFAALYTGTFRWPGIDFWHAWAVAGVASKEVVSDVYSHEARVLLYKATMPPYGPKDSSSREQVAASTSAALDSAVLGYRGLNVVHTPLLLMLFRVINTGNYERDYQWFMAVSLACFFASVVVLGLLAGFSVPISLVTTAALALTLDAEASELRVGNINNIQLAMVAAFLLLQRRQSLWADIASGAILALVSALKPNVALLVVAVGLTWMGDRLWRKILNVCVGLAVGALMAVGLPAAVIPSATWSSWISAVLELLGSAPPLEQGNFAFSAIISEHVGYDVSLILLGLGFIILGAVALGPLWSENSNRSGQRESYKRTFFSVSAGAMLLLLSSRLVWIHYMILATPALVLFLRSLMEQHRLSFRSWLCLTMLPMTSGCMAALNIVGVTTSWIAVAMNLSLLVLFAHTTQGLWHATSGP